jgi:MYXO-CTERM domain-containing protein
LIYPTGIAISGTNLFAITDLTGAGVDGQIAEYSTSGALLNASLISGLDDAPYEIAISGNDLYIVSQNNNNVSEYTTAGQLLSASLISSGLDSPDGIAIYGNDMFISNSGNGTVGEYELDGTPVNADLINGLNHPIGIVVVPEPSAGALAVLGAAALCLWRRRK